MCFARLPDRTTDCPPAAPTKSVCASYSVFCLCRCLCHSRCFFLFHCCFIFLPTHIQRYTGRQTTTTQTTARQCAVDNSLLSTPPPHSILLLVSLSLSLSCAGRYREILVCVHAEFVSYVHTHKRIYGNTV